MTNNQSRQKNTVINTAFGLLQRSCNAILSFVSRTVFIYILGLEYTGVSAVFTDILLMLSFSELGIGTAITTALYVPLKEHNESRIRKLMNFYKNAYRVIAVFILIVGIALIPFLDRLITNVPNIKEDIRIVFLFYIVRTSISYLFIYKTMLLTADQKQYQVKGLETVCTIARYVIQLLILVVFKNFLLYLTIDVIGTFVQNVIVSRKAVKQYPFVFKNNNEKLDRSEVKTLFKDVKGLALYKVSGTVGNSIDNVLTSSVIGTDIVGVLSNYTLIKMQIEQVLNQFFSAVTPSIGNLVAEKDEKKQLLVFKRIYYLSFFVVNFCSCSLFVLYEPFIKMWLGAKCVLSNSIAFIIAFDFFLYILLQAIASFRTANGIFVKGQYRPLIMAVLNIILSLILINKYGIFGTILATSICRLLTQWYDPYLLYKYVFKSSFKHYYIQYWGYILLFISGSALTFIVSRLIVFENQWIRILYCSLCCIFIPNIWIVFFTHRKDEFKYFFNMVVKRFFKKR